MCVRENLEKLYAQVDFQITAKDTGSEVLLCVWRKGTKSD